MNHETSVFFLHLRVLVSFSPFPLFLFSIGTTGLVFSSDISSKKIHPEDTGGSTAKAFDIVLRPFIDIDLPAARFRSRNSIPSHLWLQEL